MKKTSDKLLKWTRKDYVLNVATYLLNFDEIAAEAEAEEIESYYSENFGDKMPKEIMENLATLKANCAK